ncbi:hypothetical protein [Rhodococcus koreensis]
MATKVFVFHEADHALGTSEARGDDEDRTSTALLVSGVRLIVPYQKDHRRCGVDGDASLVHGRGGVVTVAPKWPAIWGSRSLDATGCGVDEHGAVLIDGEGAGRQVVGPPTLHQQCTRVDVAQVIGDRDRPWPR